MSPLGFDTNLMYNFIAKRFRNTNIKVQEQALNWLQMLTRLEITIPLIQLFSMFDDGISIKENTLINTDIDNQSRVIHKNELNVDKAIISE